MLNYTAYLASASYALSSPRSIQPPADQSNIVWLFEK